MHDVLPSPGGQHMGTTEVWGNNLDLEEALIFKCALPSAGATPPGGDSRFNLQFFHSSVLYIY